MIFRSLVILLPLLLLAAPLIAAPSPKSVGGDQTKGPSTWNPRNVLWVTFTDQLANWRSESDKLNREIESTLKELAETPGGCPPYEAAMVRILRLKVISAKMIAFGEPAGEDLELRCANLEERLMGLVGKKARGYDKKSDVARKIDSLPKKIDTAAKKINKLSKRKKRSNHERAYNDYSRIVDPVLGQEVWWRATKGRNKELNGLIVTTRKKFYSPLRSSWKKLADKTCSEALAAEPDRLGKLAQQVRDASATLETSGTFASENGEITGPQAFGHFSTQWINAQLTSLRRRCFKSILSNMRSGSRVGGEKLIEEEIVKHTKLIESSLVKIIESDAKRCSAEDAATYYLAYLEHIPSVLTRSVDPSSFEKRIRAALEKLAARSPDLQSDITSYRAATDDVMRWRRRTVSAYLRVNRSDYKPLGKIVRSACTTPEKKRLLTQKRYGRDWEPLARTKNTVPVLIHQVKGHFLGKNTSVGRLNYTSRRGDMWISPYDQRSVAYVKAQPELMEPFVQGLAADLFAQDGSTPMTLDAQMSVYTAQIGDVVDVGGEIGHFGLIGLLARYTTLHEDDRGLVRLGRVTEEPERIRNTDLMLMFLIKPAWFAHSCFFVSIPKSE